MCIVTVTCLEEILLNLFGYEPRTCCDFRFLNFSKKHEILRVYSVKANNNLLILPRTCAQLFLHVFHYTVCLYNYHWVYSKMGRTQGTVWRQRWLYTEIENYPKGERDSLKQFRDFPKPFLSALIKFVQSKPIIYENKTIWKRWRSNTLSLSLSRVRSSPYTRRR